MNAAVTSKEEILKTSRELIRQQRIVKEKGLSAVNMRSVAAECNVAVGSIYNYFDSKAALMSETIGSVWQEIFHRPDDADVFRDVQTCITWIYTRIAYGCEQYPGFFTLHSIGFLRDERPDGKRRMQQTWGHILTGLCSVLKRDARVRPDAFTDAFTAEQFADVLFSQMLSAMLRQDYDPTTVLEIVRRTLY